MMTKKIALALGGGGSKGIAHIGVIKTLVKNGFVIDSISGTSIGSMIASVYAFGYGVDEMIDLFKGIDQTKLYSFPFADGPGFLGYRGIKDFLDRTLGEATFDDLQIRCSVSSVDLDTDRVVEIHTGVVKDAVLASIAIPGIFPPQFVDGMTLVDGGVLDPVPVRSAKRMSPDLPVVAVTLSTKTTSDLTLAQPAKKTLFNERLATQISRTNLSRTFRILMDSIESSSRQMSELRLEIDRPDIIIRPSVSHIGLLDPVNIDDMVTLGELATIGEVTRIRRAKMNLIEKILNFPANWFKDAE